MPDSKITALTALTAADPAVDMFPVVDVSDTTMAASGTTKRISINNILACSPAATLASATISGDLTVATNRLSVSSTGVQIGTTTNKTTAFTGNGTGLTIGAALAPTIALWDTTNASYVGSISQIDADMYLTNTAVGQMVFSTDNTSRYTISSTGVATWSNVGGVAGTAMTLNSTGLLVGTTATSYGAAGRGLVVAGGSTSSIIGMRVGSTDTGYIFADATKVELGGNGAVPIVINNGGAAVTIDTARNVGIGVTPAGTGGCLQLKSGITFPATQVASSDPNTLDDYEEGSWVPTLNSGTFSAASCRYTKIGNMVTIFFDVTVGTGGGDRITNLPFAAASTSTVANGIYTNNQTYAAGTTAPVVVVGGSSSTLFFRTVGTGVAFSAMTLTAAANLTGSISYFV